MKKIMSLLMAMVLVLGLCACGSSASDNQPAEAAPAGDAATEAAPAEVIDPVTIHIATASFENEPTAQMLKYFGEKCAELSNGAVDVTISYGGAEYDIMGVFDALSNGAIQAGFMFQAYSMYLPYLSYATSVYSTSTADAIEKTNYIFYENEETAQLIRDQFAQYNMIPLNNMGASCTTFMTSFEWDTLDSLVAKCTAFGTMNTPKYEALGLTCTAVRNTEAYDSFSRGIIDGESIALDDAVNACLYEVAPYITIDNQRTCGASITVNADWFNGLTEAQQNVITEAAQATEVYSAEYRDGAFDDLDAAWFEATGNHVGILGEEESLEWFAMTFNNTANNLMMGQAGTENDQGMLTILSAFAEHVGVDWTWNK